MDEEDRKKLIENTDKLVREIDWREIFPLLLKHKIFGENYKVIQKWQKHLDDIDNNRDIYLSIRLRGPKAFDSFVQCLREVNRNDLANLLKPNQVDNENEENIPEINGNIVEPLNNQVIQNELFEEDDYFTKLQYVKEPLKIRVKKSTKLMEAQNDIIFNYAMFSNPRGLVLIINNILFSEGAKERAAAKHDEDNLKELFEQMGFKVIVRQNLTREEMLEVISAFSKRPDLRHVSSMFLIIMSHGHEHVEDNRSESVVCGTDNKIITAFEVFNFFTTRSCPHMTKKPKVFIFQTCRGEKEQRMVESDEVGTSRHEIDINQMKPETPPAKPMGSREYSDMLVAFSTLPGFTSHRDTLNGSWFIQAFCEVTMNHAHDTDLLRLFQITDERLSYMHAADKEVQTANICIYGFTKKCYLNPGYFKPSADTE
ncbi:caspase Dronc isoform X2 [Diprion similis]|uniref:caspase Dronc isoform X2 n=1 Tax=Diprion similis TaxID=362088 RepID=UPI001EF817C1|nr:caspase Dronc isoform X2 [Diprion similis]